MVTASKAMKKGKEANQSKDDRGRRSYLRSIGL